ncbi:MAG: hypothetical protein ACRCWQ_06610, partial [Bacilli bacterium]
NRSDTTEKSTITAEDYLHFFEKKKAMLEVNEIGVDITSEPKGMEGYQYDVYNEILEAYKYFEDVRFSLSVTKKEAERFKDILSLYFEGKELEELATKDLMKEDGRLYFEVGETFPTNLGFIRNLTEVKVEEKNGKFIVAITGEASRGAIDVKEADLHEIKEVFEINSKTKKIMSHSFLKGLPSY